MNAFINHFIFEFFTGIRNKTLLLMNYLFPLGFYVLMGLLMAQINPYFADTIIPAMAVFTIMVATLLGLPDPLVTSREKGIFRSYKINGVPIVSILIIPALTTIFHVAIVTIIITVTAPIFFNGALPVNWLNYVLIFLLMVFTSSGMGVLIGVVSSSSRMTVLWSQLIFLPSMILGGLILPYNMLPKSMHKIAQLLPATHAMNAFKGLSQNLTADFDPIWSIIILLASGVLAFVLAIFLFNWDNENTTRRRHPLLALLVLLPYVIGMFLLS